MSKDTFIFISRSGGGKGTQIDLIEKHLKEKNVGEIFRLSAGERFRDLISRGTYTGEIAKEVNDNGQLQPVFLAVWAWGGQLVRSLKKGDIIFADGNPRRVEEAKMLDEAFEFYGRKNVDVVYIDVSREWSIERMKERHRDDDENFEARKKRLDWFDSEVLPVIDYLVDSPRYNVIKVNGEQSIEDVNKEIMKKLSL